MNGYETYKLFHAISLHFTSDDYDFFRYRGKTNISPNAWYQRQDKYYFEKLGLKRQQRELVGIIVSYYVMNGNQKRPWGRELVDHISSGYVEWQKNIESLPNTFKDDLLFMKNYAERNLTKFSKLFQVNGVPQPPFADMIIQRSITLESVIVFDTLTNCIKKMDNKIEDDLLWPEHKRLIDAYRPFLEVDKKKYKKILMDVFEK